MISSAITKTQFHVRCLAEQVYLRVQPEHGSSEMFPLHKSGEQDWHLALALRPGLYHFRYYYVEQGGRLMMYHPPEDHHDAIGFDGLDGVLYVRDRALAASHSTGRGEFG